MNEKALAVAIIFLAAAIIVPIYVLYEQTFASINDFVRQVPNLADETARSNFLHALSQGQQLVLIGVAVVEVILVVGFAVSFWYAIKCTKKDKCLNFPGP